jgi:hypothetical protein
MTSTCSGLSASGATASRGHGARADRWCASSTSRTRRGCEALAARRPAWPWRWPAAAW